MYFSYVSCYLTNTAILLIMSVFCVANLMIIYMSSPI